MSVFLLLLFLVWPFGSVIFSLVQYNVKWTKNIIWGFVVFYGALFVLSNETMDANRIKEKFEFFYFNDFNITDVLKYFYLDNENAVDIIQPLILYITSKLSSNFQFLMAILALILGFFYSRNICYLYDKSATKIKPFNYLIIWMFIFVIGFWEINMFRFWTSALMFFYAITPFLLENKKGKLWLLFLTPFLHFSFLLPLAAFLFYFFVKNKITLIFYLFLLSFFLTSLNTETIGNILMEFLPQNFHSKISAYTSASYAEKIAAAETSMSKYLRLAMFAIINISFVILYYGYGKVIKKDKNLYKLFIFTLLIMAVGNLASSIPSGDRFQYLSALFSFAFIFFFIQEFGLKGKFGLYMRLVSPLLILSSLGLIRLALNTIDILVVLGNPIVAPFIEGQKALIEFF